eukprot:jgi/Hompol1/198/HPOL_005264-RA
MAASAKTVHVIIHSLWGHTKTIADEVMVGLNRTGVKAKLWKVPEILPQPVLERMHAKPIDLPVITSNDLVEADGIMFGISTRYGGASASMRAFIDTTGGLFVRGALAGKFGGVFTTTSSQHGGIEATPLSIIPFFVHQGMIFVPLGSTKEVTDVSQVHGASPYGAGTIATNDGLKNVTELEKKIARDHGELFGSLLANRLK